MPIGTRKMSEWHLFCPVMGTPRARREVAILLAVVVVGVLLAVAR